MKARLRSIAALLARPAIWAWGLLNIWDDTESLYPANPSDQSGIAQGATAYRVAGNLSGF